MSKTFLFRFDGARENDAFLEAARSKGHVVYAGLVMTLERGWIPDFIEVVVEDDGAKCSMTLVELEATENVALVSARKYLAEPSESVSMTFRQYLQRVLQRCRSTADPRAQEIQRLNDALLTSPVTVWTAAALRQPPRVVERLPLSDQRRGLQPSAVVPQNTEQPAYLAGEVSLSARDHKTLSRSVLILDAVVRGWDKSDASLRAWRNLRAQPLRREIQKHTDAFPALAALLLGQKSGVRLTINDAARELSEIWNRLHPGRHSEPSVLAAITNFLPVDRALDPNASVRVAFERARPIVNEDAA